MPRMADTQGAVRIDPRYYDAVLIDLDDTAGHLVADSLVRSCADLARQLCAVGITAVIRCGQAECVDAVRAAGIAQTCPTVVGPGAAGVASLADQFGLRRERGVVIAHGEAAVGQARDTGFALVIGVDETGDVERLRRCGADAVVPDAVGISVPTGYRRQSELDDAARRLEQIAGMITTRQPVVLVDFDGTLSEIVNDPGAAQLTPEGAEAIRAIAARCPVAVVSGRAVDDVRQRVGIPGVWYAGCHGLQLTSPDGSTVANDVAAASVDVLRAAADDVERQLTGIDGVLVERKVFAVAVHYRNAAAARVPTIESVVKIVGQRLNLRVTGGRKVVELRPTIDWDKGSAVEWLIGRMSDAELQLPIYLGDDLTDEDAFDAIRHRGLGVVVRHDEDGDRPTAAHVAVAGPDAVCAFLVSLADRVRRDRSSAAAWTMTFDGYVPHEERLRESLGTVGNGYQAVRGSAPECRACAVHYPGTYVAGIYDRLDDEVGGIAISNESMVNLPSWLPLTFRFGDGPWFDVDDAEVLSYALTVDLRHAMVLRTFRIRDHAGHVVAVTQRRFVAMHLPHVGALDMQFVAENYSGAVVFRSGIDGDVANTGVQRYRDLSSRHLVIERTTAADDASLLLEAVTVQSTLRVAVAVRTVVHDGDGLELAPQRHLVRDDRSIAQELTVDVVAGRPVFVEKVAAVFTGRDHAIAEPAADALRELERVSDWTELARGHRVAWAHLWERFAVDVGVDDASLRVVRLHQMHLLQTLSVHTADLDVGVPARGLHGEAYRGHVFWDELFVFPVTNLRLPMVTKSLLMYRYRRLPEARRAARAAGFAGAMFPWQSASDGREVSQQLHLNPRSGHWCPDFSARAHHVGIAVAYDVWQYYQVTGDIGFLIDYGAELLAEVARFWVSRCEFDSRRGRYVVRGVVGPDEFHSGYPGRAFAGVDDNAYTNVMAVWVILRALDAMATMPDYYRLSLLEALGIDDPELRRWDDVSRRMFVPFHDGVISQFDGYADLQELDWAAYRERYPDLQRLDRILEAEGDDVNRYQAGKQADTVMLFYLLSADELYELFARLGYRLTPEQIPRTIAYYQSRTSHGSTLSAVVHSWVLARGNRHEAMHYFRQALASDVVDVQSGTTAEGIHLAAMAGSIDLLQRCFTGLEFRSDRLVVGPLWPRELGPLAFAFRYRGHRLWLRAVGRRATLTAEPSDAPAVVVECRGRTQTLRGGGTVDFEE